MLSTVWTMPGSLSLSAFKRININKILILIKYYEYMYLILLIKIYTLLNSNKVADPGVAGTLFLDFFFFWYLYTFT